jgi:hypothetical protein
VRCNSAECSYYPTIMNASLTGLLTSWRAIETGNAGAIGTDERVSVAVRTTFIERVANLRAVHQHSLPIAHINVSHLARTGPLPRCTLLMMHFNRPTGDCGGA